MTIRHFEFSEGSSDKFWEISLTGGTVTTRYGKRGSSGQTTVKDAGTAAAASSLLASLVAQKVKKGYREVTAGPVATAAKTKKAPAAPKNAAVEVRGLKVCLRGTFDLGAAKDIEKALKEKGAKVTKFWDQADLVFAGEKPGYFPNVKGRTLTEQHLATVVTRADVAAQHASRMTAATPKAVTQPLPADEARFRDAFWANPDDRHALRVWADALAERGDLRGEYLQLCLADPQTDEQYAAARALEKKHASQLVGPARPFLRTYSFGNDGLVQYATTEAPRVVEGFELIAALNPRLRLGITSLRTKTMPIIAELVKHPLRKIHHLDFSANGLSDKACISLAPGLVGVRSLDLSTNDLTGEGLAAMAPSLAELEALGVGPSMAQVNARTAGAAVGGLIDVLSQRGRFPKLKALVYRGGYGMPVLSKEQVARLGKVRVATSFDELER